MPKTPSTARDLARVLGPWTATAIVVGTVIGSGVFKKPQNVALHVHEFGPTLAVWLLGGVLAMLGALVLAEIAILLPRAGGNYVYLREGYGRAYGFLWGWVEFWIIRTGSIAALASIFVDSLHDVIRHFRGVASPTEVIAFWPRQGMTVATIAVLALVNARGTRWGGLLQLVLTLVKVGSLLAIGLLPFVVWGWHAEPVAVPTTAYLSPWWPSDWSQFSWSGVGGAMVGVLWAYHGWMNVAPVAEEVKNPSRNIPLALIGGTMLVTGLYLAANVAYALVVPRPEMAAATGTTVATIFSTKLLGAVGTLFASAAVMISVFGSLNGNLLVGPRLLFAMGRDGLAPTFLSRIHPRYGTPALAIGVLAAWASVLIVGGSAWTAFRIPEFTALGQSFDLNLPPGKPLFDVVTDYAMFGAITFETLSISTIFVLRRRFPVASVPLPYRCWGYPVVPLAYIAVMTAVLFNMFTTQRNESLLGLAFIAVGAAVFLAVYARRAPA